MSELDRKTSWRLWVIAAVCAVVLHVGGIAAAVYEMQQEEDADGLGADAIEVGMEMVSPDVEQTDLPQGPDSEASAASPAVQEQKAVQKPSDLPQEQPHESQDADRVVTESKAEKVEEETLEKAQKQQQASQEAVASEAAAQRKLEDSKSGDKAQAPQIGLGADKKRLVAKWQKQLVAFIERKKQNPDVQNFKNVTVSISFTLDRTGRIISSTIAEGSGDPAYDQAAISILQHVKQFPAPPPELADETLTYVVPIIFKRK